MVPGDEGEKMYQVPCRSPEDRQPWFDAFRSTTLPVLLELLLNDCPLQMVAPPTQSVAGGAGVTQVTVCVKFTPVTGGVVEAKMSVLPVRNESRKLFWNW